MFELILPESSEFGVNSILILDIVNAWSYEWGSYYINKFFGELIMSDLKISFLVWKSQTPHLISRTVTTVLIKSK
jgi:hypothetical protein